MRWWWGVWGVLLIVGWRVWWWQQVEQRIIDGTITSARVMLVEAPQFWETGCQWEWRGWRLYGFQSICDISNQSGLTAGSVIHLDFRRGQRDLGGKQLQLVRIEVISPRHGGEALLSRWLNWADRWRTALSVKLRRLLPENEALLLAGILWGERSHFSEQLYQALIHTGTMHVVAASGFNISVVMGALLWVLLSVVSRKKAAGITLVLVWIYVLVSGLQPPIVRAGLTASMMLMAWIVGREVWMWFGYVMSGVLMLIVAPWWLTSISFQLSMAATAGVIWGTAALGRITHSIRLKLEAYPVMVGMWDNLMTTLAATIAVAPLSLIYFGQISWWGLVVNPIVLGMIPVLMYLGIAVVVLGVIWFPLGQIMAWLVLPLARLWLGIVLVGGMLPGGVVEATVSWWWAVGWWLMWAGVILYIVRSKAEL